MKEMLEMGTCLNRQFEEGVDKDPEIEVFLNAKGVSKYLSLNWFNVIQNRA